MLYITNQQGNGAKKKQDEDLQKQIEEKLKNPEPEEEQNEVEQMSNINVDELLSGDFIKSFLTEEEYNLFLARREYYLNDFELNDSGDEILLQNLLLKEIKRIRLIKKTMERSSPQLEEELDKCSKAITEYQEKLGMLRKQRMNQKDEVNNSLADLVVQFDKEKVNQKLEQYYEEEEERLKQRKKRVEKIGGSYEKSIQYFDNEYTEYVEGETGDVDGNSQETS